jgi:hypothetical protein
MGNLLHTEAIGWEPLEPCRGGPNADGKGIAMHDEKRMGALLRANTRKVAAGALAWVLTLAAQTAAAASSPAELYIDLRAPSDQTSRSWPVTAGVPFPPGARPDGADVSLQPDGKGAPPIPVQTRVLSRWSDGSVRWMLLDWQADLSPKQRRYRIAAGKPARPPKAVTVVQDDDAVSIDTGALQLTIPKKRFALLDDVRLDGKTATGGAVTAFVDVQGTRYPAQPPTGVAVLEDGPLRARVELRGAYGADLHYVVRIDALADQPFVRVLHSFEQRGSAPFTSLRQIGIEIPLQSTAKLTYRAGREKDAPLTGKLGEKSVTILQEDNETLKLNGTAQQGRTAGWVDVHDGTRGLAVAGRFVWQEYPQSFHLDPARLTYNLRAPEVPAASVGMGAAKTHEFVLYFSGRTPPAATQLATIAQPLMAHVNPAWVVASGALPNSIAPGKGTAAFIDELRAGFRRYQGREENEAWDDGGTLRCNEPERERRRQGLYGMLNWGDWNFPVYHDMVNGCDTWGNLEYDMTEVLALAYAATGDAEFHTAMTAAARHFMDVDRIHYAPRACDCVGMTHQRTALHFSFELGGPDLGYAWTEGLRSYFWLTGDERALEAVRGIADYLARHLPASNEGLAPRQWGWPAIALLGAYDATGVEAYKTAAREYARRGMETYPPTSGRDPGVGTLADALAYIDAATPDPAGRDWLTNHTAAVMASPPGADPRYFPAVAYVGRVTSNAAYQRTAAEAVPRQPFGDWGKPFTLAGRLGFRILSLCQ